MKEVIYAGIWEALLIGALRYPSIHYPSSSLSLALPPPSSSLPLSLCVLFGTYESLVEP